MKADKLDDKQKLNFLFDLINAFSIVKTPEETADFIQDILTAKEIRNLYIRLRIARLLLSGKTYEEIMSEIKVSTATITKVSAWINRSGEGFRNVIARLPVKYDYPKKLSKGSIEYHLPEAITKLTQYNIAEKQNKLSKSLNTKVQSKAKYDKQLDQITSETYIKKLRRNTLVH